MVQPVALHEFDIGPIRSHGVQLRRVMRSRGFSTTRSPDTRNFPGWAERVERGGADRFLRCLRAELMPFVEARYRTTPGQSYVSHATSAFRSAPRIAQT